jgi:integrase
MASIEQRRGKPAAPDEEGPLSYRVVWRHPDIKDPKKRKQSATFGSETLAVRGRKLVEARDHRVTKAELEAEILGVTAPEPANTLPTVRDWATTWLASRTRISDGQVGRYEQQLRTVILPAIGHLTLDEVGGTDIANILNDLRSRFKAGTVTRYYACMHAMFAFAVLEKKIDDNPAKRTDFVRDMIAEDDADDDGAGHVYLTPAEYLLIRRNLQPAARPLADYLIHTGARYSEATAAAVKSIDFTTKKARIHRAWKRRKDGSWHLGSTKGRARRGVPFDDTYAAELKTLTGGRDPDELLFVTAVNNSMGGGPRGGGNRWMYSNFRERYWEPAIGAAMRCTEHPPPLPAKNPTGPRRGWLPTEVSTCDCPGRLKQRPTPHDLRHSFVAWMIAAGRPLVSISRRLGHFSVTLTERVYAGILPEVDEADGAVIGAALAQAA